jgi:hypothetical protein
MPQVPPIYIYLPNLSSYYLDSGEADDERGGGARGGAVSHIELVTMVSATPLRSSSLLCPRMVSCRSGLSRRRLCLAGRRAPALGASTSFSISFLPPSPSFSSSPSSTVALTLRQLETIGFCGVQNFPTVGLFDGNFRHNLEETGMGYKYKFYTF